MMDSLIVYRVAQSPHSPQKGGAVDNSFSQCSKEMSKCFVKQSRYREDVESHFKITGGQSWKERPALHLGAQQPVRENHLNHADLHECSREAAPCPYLSLRILTSFRCLV